ncbi:U3 snoRNP protein, partial [Exophiala xenobiotica]
MAPTKIKERGQKTLPADVLEKDEVELRLEKALFGDDAGFLKSLTREQPHEAGQLSRGEDTGFEGFGTEDDQEELDDVADEDLFFLDAGTGQLPAAISKDLERTEPLHTSLRGQSTWYDSDDDRITVSLANNTRLRKLRDTEDDDL